MAEIAVSGQDEEPARGVVVHRPPDDLAVRDVVRTAAARTAAVARRPDRIVWECLRHELVYGSIGTARAAGRAWRWVTAAELDQQLATQPQLVLSVRRVRQRVAAAALAVAGTGGVVAWLVVSPAVPVIVVALVLAVAGSVERHRQALGDAEAGRATLGPSPSGRAVKKALAAAKLGKVDDLRVVGPVVRTEGAWEATVELPPGTTYRHATRRRGELAGAIGVDEVQVALDPVKGHNGRVRLWVADEDPMQGSAVMSPLINRTKPIDFWTDRVFAGMDQRGRPVEFSLVERSYLVGGEPGGGKSVACNNFLAFAALDPHVQLWIADGKGGFDLADWEPIAKRVLAEPEHEQIMDMIEDLRDEMARRYKLLRKAGHRKVTKEVARQLDMCPIVFHVDEIQKFSLGDGDARKGREFITGVADLVGRGRASGIITGAVTQRPAADVVPTRLRDILSIRWALRCTTPDASDTILGSGRAGQGYSAASFDASQRGAGYLLAEGASPVQTRSAFIADEEVAGIARRAYALREAAGTLPARADRPEVRLLSAVLEAMGSRHKGAHTAELLESLARVSGEYADWDATRLAAALRPLGVAPVQLDLEGTNRNGYRRVDVQSALERV